MLDLVARIEAAELPGGRFVVSAHGPLDERAAGDLRDVLLPLAGAEGAAVVLDLEDAHGLDEGAVDVVGRAARIAAERGGRLAIVTRSPFVTRLIDEAGLLALVSLHSTLRRAIAGE